MRRRRILLGAVAAAVCTIAAVGVLLFARLPQGAMHAAAPSATALLGPAGLGDVRTYLGHVEPIRERIVEVTKRNAAGDFPPLAPEQRTDLTDSDVAEAQRVARENAKLDLAAMEQGFPTPEKRWKAAFELEGQHRSGPAFIQYLKAAELKPNFAAAFAGMGRTLQVMGHTTEATEAFQTAVRLGPSKPEWLVDLGLSLYTDGKFDEALAMYDLALKARPNLARAHYNKAVVYWRKGDYDAAWRSHDKCVALGMEPLRTFTERLEHDSGRQQPTAVDAPEGNPARGQP